MFWSHEGFLSGGQDVLAVPHRGVIVLFGGLLALMRE